MFKLRLLGQKLASALTNNECRRFCLSSVLHYEKVPENEPFCALPGRCPKLAKSGQEAFEFIKSGANVFIQGGSATPTFLLKDFHDYVVRNDLTDITLYHLPLQGEYPFTNPENQHRFRPNAFFTGDECRWAVNDGRADYIPVFLSEIPLLFDRGLIRLDLALISITPPDKHGLCSLGPSLDVTRSAILNAKRIVAQSNDRLPWCRGEASVHISHVDVTKEGSMPCHIWPTAMPTPTQEKIGRIIAENLIDDGSTIQVGVGGIPTAILSKLVDHKDLGVHSDILSDEMVRLVENGVITNAYKQLRPGKIVACLALGTSRVFNFIDDNPMVELVGSSWVCHPINIARNSKPVSIGTCIEIDLTGQITSDSIGTFIYGGCGAQLDFLRGACISLDNLGKPIVALNSTTKTGESKIVPVLKTGAGVVLTRAHVHYVVTEYGIAQLFGKSIRQRARALIDIAHPKHRESLEQAAYENLKVMPSLD
ncbi:unnamed protein product [Calicophoron daubneyi]|uniref:Acetyl-CoA hydrolase n=1 Tax=Calicophoron daubneyi TaxID=300641 RepID=A0AAV2T9P4_CALDB